MAQRDDEKKAQSLQDELESLKFAVNSAYDGVHILDKNGYTLMLNDACERIEGIKYEDIKDKNIRQLVEEGYFSDSVTLKVLERKQPVTIIQKVKNGNEVLVTGMPVYKDGEIDRVIINSRDITELSLLKRELSEHQLLAEKYHAEWQKLSSLAMNFGDIICNSQSMNKVVNLALNVAKVDSTVLITGESGTGKGFISKFIHDNSLRKEQAFVKIDCGTIPEALFESELFGFEKGSFTGADTKGKLGLVQLADRGTLFLDEIGEIPLAMQPKLLRLLQDRKIVRVGGKEEIPVDIRIIVATNRDLGAMVKDGRFREDLYYRLNVIPMQMPSLRQRREDIDRLAINLVNKLNNQYNTNKRLDMAAMELLIKYDWPGNVRELENIIERIFVLSEKQVIEVKDLPEALRKSKQQTSVKSGGSLKATLDALEKQVFEELLGAGCGTSELSQRLQIDATTVRRKRKKYNL